MTTVSVKTVMTVDAMPENMFAYVQNIWLPMAACKGACALSSALKSLQPSTMCAATGTRQGQRSAREQLTAPGHTASDQTGRCRFLAQLHN